MSDPQPFPIWIFALFPVFFAVLWLFVTGLLASMGGWSELARHYRDPGEAARGNAVVLSGVSVGLRRGWIPLPANYNHCATLALSATGLHLRVMAVFRFRHPPLLIPWTQVERVEPGTVLFFRILTVYPRGTSTHINLYGSAANAVEEAWGRRAAGSTQLAPA